MEQVEMHDAVVFGTDEKPVNVTEIKVQALNFKDLAMIWQQPHYDPSKPELSLQKRRIMFQAHFMVGQDRYKPDMIELGQVDFRTIRGIIDALETGYGNAGEVISKDADGLTKPILYKLGDPIKMGGPKGKSEIAEIEFMGRKYAELEDVLAADNSMAQTLALLRRVGRPVGHPLPLLPENLIENISVADGVTIMRDVLPAF